MANSEISSNKRIAKNTILLYIRMMLLMAISLYTSRVILEALGETDYGIYGVVGGIVGSMAFLQGVLSTSSSRFLSYEIGVGDKKKMALNFSTIFYVHLIFAIIIVILSETVGVWFLYNKMTIPHDRLGAAMVALQCSTIAVVVSVMQIPYNSSIISHENMNIYAYMSILEAVLKLAIVYVLLVTPFDRLRLYSILVLAVNVFISLLYRWFCIKHYKETKLQWKFDKKIFKEILGYSFWNLLTNITMTLKNQGVIMLISAFFSPAIVAARTIANKVNVSVMQFSNNFRLAANPQIIKRYSSGDREGSKILTIQASKFNFFLMWILGLPIILLSEPILNVWLTEVPEYTAVFMQLVIATSIIDSMQNTFYTALCAVGRLKLNSILTSFVSIFVLPVGYLFYKMGYNPASIAYIIFIDDIILSFVVKPYVMIRETDYTVKDLMKIFIPCGYVSLLSGIFPCILYFEQKSLFSSELVASFVIGVVSVLSCAIVIWTIGLDKQMRTKLIEIISNRLRKLHKH